MSRYSSAIGKYVRRHAMPEAVELAAGLDGRYDQVVVVPACGETPGFLDALERAARVRSGRVLRLVVVNARDDAPESTHALNQTLLEHIAARGAPDLVAVDRASAGKRLPAGEGVGTARRIGCDIAVALAAAGRLAEPWIFNTDGDARVPEEYFAAAQAAPADAVALSLPFVHEPSGDPAVDRAHALYEISLRYYCLGLDWAGSSYSHHSMGSAMVFRVDAYAAARGMPRREAAEDFYMLDKLAKLGRVAMPPGPQVAIHSRLSDRVPFGTGRAVATIVDDRDPFALYDPRCFAAVARVQAAIDEGSERAVNEVCDDATLGPAFEAVGLRAGLMRAWSAAAGAGAYRRRAREWFDGFRTMRLIHELRDRAFANLPWRLALRDAPFVQEASTATDDEIAIAETATALFALERRRLRNG